MEQKASRFGSIFKRYLTLPVVCGLGAAAGVFAFDGLSSAFRELQIPGPRITREFVDFNTPFDVNVEASDSQLVVTLRDRDGMDYYDWRLTPTSGPALMQSGDMIGREYLDQANPQTEITFTIDKFINGNSGMPTLPPGEYYFGASTYDINNLYPEGDYMYFTIEEQK